MIYLHCLIKPENYYEKDIQQAIITLWPCLFDQYQLLDRDYINMPSQWQPDLVAEHTNEKHSFLIIELKGKRPSGTREMAVKQVVGYAKWLHEEFPHVRLRLIVIGPYDQDNRLEFASCDGYQVGVIQLVMLGHYLLRLAERTLLWHATNPFAAKPEPLKDLETIVLALEANTRNEGKDSEEVDTEEINDCDEEEEVC